MPEFWMPKIVSRCYLLFNLANWGAISLPSCGFESSYESDFDSSEIFCESGSIGRKEGSRSTIKRTGEVIVMISVTMEIFKKAMLTNQCCSTCRTILKKIPYFFIEFIKKRLWTSDFCEWFLNYWDEQKFYVEKEWFHFNDIINGRNMLHLFSRKPIRIIWNTLSL